MKRMRCVAVGLLLAVGLCAMAGCGAGSEESNAPIVGTWTIQRFTLASLGAVLTPPEYAGTLTFNSDGTYSGTGVLQLTHPGTETYSTSGETLTWTLDGVTSQDRFVVEGDTMILTVFVDGVLNGEYVLARE